MPEINKTIIVGGGLAGLSLGYFLYKKNIPFEIHTHRENHSSIIAAGLINPIVFRRTTKSWEVDTFLPFAKKFYLELEKELNVKIWNDLIIRRSFSHEQEHQDWVKKQQKAEYKDYLGELNTPSPSNLYTEYGTGLVKGGAWIHTENLIFGLRAFFEQKGFLHYLDIKDANKPYHESSNRIVFCEGYELIKNLYFNYLPLDPTKGQTLTIQSDNIPTHESINRKCFVLPTENKTFRVGATYEWSDSSLNITKEGKELLEADLNNLIQANYSVLEQKAGVRPTVKDRRPLLGQHPKHTNLFVFNGLGTKGYLIAPYLAYEMSQLLIHQKALNKEIDIKRYEAFFNT